MTVFLCTTQVTREVSFPGEITPPKELSMNETIKGVNYSGTLKLQKYSHISGTTIATYTGVLYKE
jgi:hypothetical protein